jgi:hypothetical protein
VNIRDLLYVFDALLLKNILAQPASQRTSKEILG